MLQKVILVSLLLSFILYGCKANNLSSQKVLETMENASSYTAEALMNVQNNKSILIYNMKQYYKKPDKFRIEFYDDSGNIEQIIISNNNRCGVFHVGISKPFISENFNDSKEHNSFLNTFLINYKKDEKAHVVLDKIIDKDYYIFRCAMEKGNSYFENVELYIDAKTAIPQQLLIYGKNNSKNIEIVYKSFSYNDKLNDSIFEIKINND